MVFKLLCLYLAVTCVFAAPPTDVVPLEKQQPTVIPIISQSEELESNGTYKYSYETGNGIKREETSYDKVLPKAKSGPSSSEGGESSDESNEIHVQQGSYSYTAPDGTVVSVRYIADENGFRLIGDHAAKVPSVVPTISGGRRVKALAQDNAEVGSAPSAIAVKPAMLETPNAPEAPETPEASKKAAQSPETSQSPAASIAPEVSQVPEISQNPVPPKEITSQAPNSPSIESRAGENSAEQVSTTESSPENNTFKPSSESLTTPESPATEATSSIEPILSTTEQAAEVTSIGALDQSTTTGSELTTEASSKPSTTEVTSESVSTTASELSTPAEPASTPAEESSTPAEVPSTPAEESSTPTEESSTPTEEPSTPAASTASS